MAYERGFGFQKAGDLGEASAQAPWNAPQPEYNNWNAPQPEYAPVYNTWSAPAAAPVSYSPSPAPAMGSLFMQAGDLLEAADGKRESEKGQRWDDISLEGRKNTVIGRSNTCDVVADRPYVAQKHARISIENGRYTLTDLGSEVGTYLNGTRVEGKVYLKERDRISMGDCNYIFTGSRLVYAKRDKATKEKVLRDTAPGKRPVVLRTNIRSKKVRSNTDHGMKELIRDIRMDVKEGTLVALLGTAGAGKSTVMNCMNGMDLQGVEGSVHYRGVNLVDDFEQMKCMIGSVPQKKVFHPAFTPEEEFTQAAILRLPADTSQKEIRERVDKTLEMLGMDGVRKNRNSKLSGGEQTRVNVGIELVADRDLLCLDEPDQGLSPNYKHELFEILRSLAHDHGKTVLTIIHDVSEIDMFDQVIILAKAEGVGRLAFSGTPEEAREHFGVDIREVYSLLEKYADKYVPKSGEGVE